MPTALDGSDATGWTYFTQLGDFVIETIGDKLPRFDPASKWADNVKKYYALFNGFPTRLDVILQVSGGVND